MTASVEEQLNVLGRGIVPTVWNDMKAPLAEKLKQGRPLRVKCGFDPTAPDLHLGHTVPMRKMRQFQEFGHHVIFLIGDFTGMIGDPTGKSKTRPPLSREDVLQNAETYKRQVFKILDPKKTEIAFNSHWLGKLTAEEIVRLAAKYTVARLLERNDFNTRYRSGQPISLHELLYPVMQGYDSVALKADVELGGNDQLFNLMVGRDLMRSYGLEAQVILTTELLLGTDGALNAEGNLVGEKMSKSLGNYIGVDDPPTGEQGMFGKVMSISDPLMWHYYEMLSEISRDELELRRKWHPKQAKEAIAFEFTQRYHGKEAAQAAALEFNKLHPTSGHDRGVPDDLQEMVLTVSDEKIALYHILVEAGLASSNSDARRLITQGGVHVDDAVLKDRDVTLDSGKSYLIRAGKRRYRKIKIEHS